MGIEKNHANLETKSDIRYVCQLTGMKNIGRELNRFEKSYQLFLRAFAAIKRRIRKRCYGIQGYCGRKLDAGAEIISARSLDRPEDGVKAGDKAKVLSYARIQSTLNPQGRFKGLSFQDPMEKYCNNVYEVLKIPEYVLDKGGRQINRCKDVVILRGIYCDGRGTLTTEGCDMSCLHYWKTDWLEKVV